MSLIISNKPLTLIEIFEHLSTNQRVIELSDQAIAAIEKSRNYLDQKLKEGGIHYGINTGFGSLYNKVVSDDQLTKLQENLLLSHACGMGDFTPKPVVELMLLTKIKSLSLGYSAISLPAVELLANFYNQKILPVIYDQGSLGASGDLSPLAHLALPLVGEGEIWKGRDGVASKQVLKAHNLKTITLSSKEGLALINGTQFITSYAIYSLYRIENLMRWAHIIAAMSIDGFNASLKAYDSRIARLRNHKGQARASKAIVEHLKGSEIQSELEKELQDPYSFRCTPQVYGAVIETIEHVKKVVENELNAVTDNPLVFADDDQIISGGNFHAEPLAIALDSLGIAISEIASISERRIFKLVSGQRGLPEFLVAQQGLNSGLMIPQYTAASVVSQNKQLSTPASVDTIDSSNGQEDHVSMGANAATKLLKVVENTEKVLAVELMCAAQAIDFRSPLKTSKKLDQILKTYRKEVPFIDQDRFMQADMLKSLKFITKTVLS